MKLLVFFLATSLYSAAQTQTAMNADAFEAYNKADLALNEAYKLLKTTYAADTLFVNQLKKTQRVWITYRDASLEMKYPALDKRLTYGSVYPMCASYYLKELTNARTAQLQEWLDGTLEGDVCSGSVRNK